MIKVEIIADSINQQNDRLTTMVLTYPRIIHAEMMTHRMFSRNASSSRAVPVKKMIESIRNNTFCPFEFQKAHKGMQGTEYFIEQDKEECKQLWLESAEFALQQAEKMEKKEISKQIINRILEPYQYYQVIITSGKEGLENFFDLRCPIYGDSIYGLDKCSITFKSKKDYCKYFNITENYQTKEQWYSHNYSQAEIHIQDLAEAMYDVYNESTPKQLQASEWHIPFGDEWYSASSSFNLKVSTARCARVSYTVVGEEGKEPNYDNDLKLHDRLLESGHFSPFEHCAKAMSDEEYKSFIKGEVDFGFDIHKHTMGWCNNFKGFIPYRYLIEKK